MDAYHRELSKLQNCPQSQLSGLLALQQQAAVAAMSNNNNNNNNNTIQGTGIAQDLSLPKDRKDIYPFVQRKDFAVKVNGTEVSDKESETVAEAMKQAGSAFSLVRPKTEQSKLFVYLNKILEKNCNVEISIIIPYNLYTYSTPSMYKYYIA